MIDIHTHILPGLDDGARDMEDSLSMAALALKSGVHTLVATSHANTGGFFKEYSIEEYLQRLEAFRKALDEVKLPLRVFSGMEIYMTREVPRMIREGREYCVFAIHTGKSDIPMSAIRFNSFAAADAYVTPSAP